jgi:hypothetical protein
VAAGHHSRQTIGKYRGGGAQRALPTMREFNDPEAGAP